MKTSASTFLTAVIAVAGAALIGLVLAEQTAPQPQRNAGLSGVQQASPAAAQALAPRDQHAEHKRSKATHA